LKKKSIKKAHLKDVKFLFNLYNSSIVENYSRTKKIINYFDHKSWFLQNINSKSTKIYILYYNNCKIGYIRINIFKLRSCYISIYIKKKNRSKNFGSLYLNAFLKIAKNKFNIKDIYAEVLKKNTFSKFFFTKNEFKLIKYSKKFKSIFNKNNFIFLKKL
jgi:RimJ/RimL family protein N-acetyltransferase